MYVAVIDAFAETASFRLPEAHTFHKTLPLPPYTTIVGLVGCALGLDGAAAQTWIAEQQVRIGVAGRAKGYYKDLWKYRKIKREEVISDVLLREYLVDLDIHFVFGCEKRDTVQHLAAAFRDPAWALAAGPSDCLLRIRETGVMQLEPIPYKRFEFCVIPGDISGRYKPDPSVLQSPITETIQAPWICLLPISFKFEQSRLRSVAAREPFTFVGHPIELDTPALALRIDQTTIVLR